MTEASWTPMSPTRPALLPGFSPVEKAVATLSQSGVEARGAVFTKSEVVDFILDLVGYTSDRPLHEHVLLEPSFGDGEFLQAAVGRLLSAWTKNSPMVPAEALAPCIRAVELHGPSFQRTHGQLATSLREAGIAPAAAGKLVDTWLVHTDFLLADLPMSFDFVVGNPPYVRQELIPDVLLTEYRARYTTIFDRADLYVPFIERSLRQLSDNGRLGFICADRWTKNRYGGPLRKLIAENFRLHVYVDMFETQAFHSDVIAYPAVFVVGRDGPPRTRVARRPRINRTALGLLTRQLNGTESLQTDGPVTEVAAVGRAGDPWMLDASDQLSLVRRLEHDFPTIEDTGCKVGIGVATGADKAFIGPLDALDVEDDRKLPLVMTHDILSGEVRWRGLGIVNPFADDGKLVALDRYPRLARYLNARKDQIAGRHVAHKNPANWYRTIDRIHPGVAQQPKLLVPDIKGDAHIVYEGGLLYPHHNLYFITSAEWDLRALQAVLLSGVARLFVATYTTVMRGGHLRFQAQYLRRIRLPYWSDVPASVKKALIAAAEPGQSHDRIRVAAELYDLDANECAVLRRE